MAQYRVKASAFYRLTPVGDIYIYICVYRSDSMGQCEKKSWVVLHYSPRITIGVVDFKDECKVNLPKKVVSGHATKTRTG